MSFSFGTSSAPKPAFGGFSTPNPQASTPNTGGGGLFGSAPTQPANPSTSLFGSTQQQQQQPAAGGGLFGSTTNQPSGTTGGTGLFGSTNQPSTGGGLFGSTSQPQQQQQNTGGGGLFGSTPSAPATGGGGLFGSTSQPQQAGGSIFGQNNAAKPAGTGLFGSTTTTQPAAGGSGLFGQSTAQAAGSTGTGLFGSTTQQQPPQQQGGSSLFGGFGQQSQQQKPAGGLFGGFGTSSTTQPQQQQQQQGLFASTNNNNNAFGQQSTNMGASTSTTTNPFGVKQEPDIETRIKQIQGAWDSNSPDCRFKYFFYNVVEEGTTSRYGRPAGANDDAKWAKALRDNPDPNCMVPVLATGWADVKKREQQQENLASVHQQRVKELQAALSHTRQTSLSASIRLSNLQSQQTQLLHRLIHVVSQTPQYVPIIQSSAFKQEEAEMQKQLEGVKSELEGKGKNSIRPSSSISLHNNGRSTQVGVGKGRLLGQVNELWGQLEEIRRKRKIRNMGGHDGGEGYNWLADEKALAEVAEILSTQQMALQKLSGLVHEGMEDMEVMRQGMGIVGDQGR
ncbi:hypothetical protein I302_100362 [Kwoniella bestiolae CBS 10118]|uniref:Nucleoporin Nup54 alpha-helical domain-containing protein n=1 Tax=Kwoniella bestiolae CBS 10118 TaxID=1296100 RepID=A0A1B9G4V0_9TREE|nr:hypothetical protein I302_03736 [Kwoniella bestiolae CBS 10118]OCF26059.1 hypothetical protein I302_03736 [Kwoniella bestiolae CBS 10118]